MFVVDTEHERHKLPCNVLTFAWSGLWVEFVPLVACLRFQEITAVLQNAAIGYRPKLGTQQKGAFSQNGGFLACSASEKYSLEKLFSFWISPRIGEPAKSSF